MSQSETTMPSQPPASQAVLAAAIRALADQVVPVDQSSFEVRRQLLATAAELEV